MSNDPFKSAAENLRNKIRDGTAPLSVEWMEQILRAELGHEGNAHLLAAAPELYAMLERVRDHVHATVAAYRSLGAPDTEAEADLADLDAVLRKARGETP